ncbi:hypothetical protein ACHQM5_022389 [Ranunculus cassubicifolius]
MGIGETILYFSDLVCITRHRRKKRKVLQTVSLKVKMDCDGCEKKVYKALSSMKGVQSVDINRKQRKVTVTGYNDSKKLINEVKSIGKNAVVWPYVPFNHVAQPYITKDIYDKKAPPGCVKRCEASDTGYMIGQESPYFATFSDENVNACTIM